MQLSNTFEVKQPVEAVWEAFADVQSVARCLPGADRSLQHCRVPDNWHYGFPQPPSCQSNTDRNSSSPMPGSTSGRYSMAIITSSIAA